MWSPSIRAVAKTGGHNQQLSIKVDSAALTDVGRKRTRNEDSFLVDDEMQFYVVADGMGGPAGGSTASRIAVETMHRELRVAREIETGPILKRTSLQDSPRPDPSPPSRTSSPPLPT